MQCLRTPLEALPETSHVLGKQVQWEIKTMGKKNSLMCVPGSIGMVMKHLSHHLIHHLLVFMQNFDRDIGGTKAISEYAVDTNLP